MSKRQTRSMFRGAKKQQEDMDEEMLEDVEDEVVVVVDSKDEIFLHVFADSHDGTLTLNTSNKTLQLKTEQSNTPEIGRFYGKESVVQFFRYPKGRALRLVNCGLSTAQVKGKQSKLIQDKLCHVALPDDRWHASFRHADYKGQDQSTCGPFSQAKAEHNAGVFARFIDELIKILGEMNVGLCAEGDVPKVQIRSG